MAPPAETVRVDPSEVVELPDDIDEVDDGAEVVDEDADDDSC
jgi:hypothetical protein